MANEAGIIELLGEPPGEPIQVTISGGLLVTKGALIVLNSDPRTAALSSGANQIFIGIAAHDNEAGNGKTRLGVYTKGIFDLTSVSGAAADLPRFGDIVEVSGANLIRRMGQNSVSGAAFLSGMQQMVGVALETASASEVIAVKLGGLVG